MYRKTSDGQDEIATRARRLAPRLRSLLIMVDGKRSTDALRALVPDADALLGELEAAGLIEQPERVEPPKAPARGEGASAGVAAGAAAPTDLGELMVTAPMALSASALKARISAASRWINERLGPAGEAAAIRVEQAKTPEQFEQALGFAARIVEARLGPSAAQALVVHVTTL